jgi:hypothetical protein
MNFEKASNCPRCLEFSADTNRSVTGWHKPAIKKGYHLKVAQEIMRHANSRITQDIYQQAVSQEKPDAQKRVVAGLLGKKKWVLEDRTLQHPFFPPKAEVWLATPSVFYNLWRGRRGSNPRPLP